MNVRKEPPGVALGGRRQRGRALRPRAGSLGLLETDMHRALLVVYLGLVLLTGCGREEEGPFELLRVLEVAGRQGVATDGQRYYVSGSTALYVYDKDGRLLLANEAPFEHLSQAANHIGDISVHEGELFAGVEHFLDGRGTNIQVVVYDAATLAYRRSIPWSPDSGQVEVSAVAVDPANNTIWMTDWVNGTYVYRYGLDTGVYQGKMRLDPVPPAQQGIAVQGGFLYITADDGDAEEDEPDGLWRVRAEPDASVGKATRVKPFTEFFRAGEIEGLDFDTAAAEMVVLNNRGKRIVKGMPKGLYPGYDREIHELYVYRTP